MADEEFLELSNGMIWSLRALAQDAHRQRELFPSFICLADALIDGFGFEIDKLSVEARSQNADLIALDQFLSEKAQELWTDEDLAKAPYWKELRELSRIALTKRGLSTFAPHPQEAAYISEGQVHDPTGLLESFKENRSKSLISKIVSLFR